MLDLLPQKSGGEVRGHLIHVLGTATRQAPRMPKTSVVCQVRG